MSQENQRQVRVEYSNGRRDSIFGPYRTIEDAKDMASKAETYAHVTNVLIERYYALETRMNWMSEAEAEMLKDLGDDPTEDEIDTWYGNYYRDNLHPFLPSSRIGKSHD